MHQTECKNIAKLLAVPGEAPTLHSPCGETVGKENRKALVESFYEGFMCPEPNLHPPSAKNMVEFLKSLVHFLRMLYKCYTFVIYNI